MRPGFGIRETAGYGLTIAAVWLAWEIIKAPVAERAPPALAVRLAPNSPEVLRRAAEAEFVAGRTENAGALAEASLAAAPFNARALRVLGLSIARDGNADQADTLLTLAGNWSLRDDPSHAWLIERRLRQGSYQSAFAHADTLARRWVDGQERIFDLFTTAAVADPRAVPVLTSLVARKPPWRSAYIQYLLRKPDGDAVLLALGLAMAKTPSAYDTQELGWVYQNWYEESRFGAIRALRAGTGRPGRLDNIQNGDFETAVEEALLPFGWRMDPASGISAALMSDDVRPSEIALRVEYDGYASGIVAQQIVMLPAGNHILSGQQRVEVSPDTSRLRWRLSCIESGKMLSEVPVSPAGPSPPKWHAFSFAFSVPPAGCQVQRLTLETDPGERRATTIAWFDKLNIAPGRTIAQ